MIPKPSYLLLAALVSWVPACRNGNATTPPAPAPSPSRARQEPAFFRDMTAQAGVDFTYRNGEEADHYAILESLGGGVGLIDYDRDGLLDLYLPGGGYFDSP